MDNEFPVTLITYGDGSMDLHMQTGTEHRRAISEAKVLLYERGFLVGELEMVGPSGAYYSVTSKI